jgi:hypothetical protein
MLCRVKQVGGGQARTSSDQINSSDAAVSHPERAIDQDLGSAAVLNLHRADDVAAQHSQVTLRGTAQAGVVFAAGSKAGVVIARPAGRGLNYSLTLSTWMNGVQQDSLNLGASDTADGQAEYLGFDERNPTTRAFDAVEVRVAETAPGLEPHEFRLFEFCGDGAAR